MKPLAKAFLLALAGATIGACVSSSPRKFQATSKDLADELVDQLGKRTDSRRVKILVYEFSPCEPPRTEPYATVKRKGHSEKELARRIKHQLISQLARKVVVVEGDERRDVRPGIAPASQNDSAFAEAQRLGANAVLVGNYTVTGRNDILVMARLVDVESNQILATAEDTLYGVEVPHGHR